MRPTTQSIHISRRPLPLSNAQIRDFFCPRQFSHKPPKLILVSHRASLRPQLPFLPSSNSYRSNVQLSRLFSISAANKKFLREYYRETIRWTGILGVVWVSFTVAGYAILTERQERAFPSPHEWGFITRWRFRRGKWYQVPENNELEGFTNWARVWWEMKNTLVRLEDPEIDGAGIKEQDEEEGGLMVPGVGKAGYDLTAKSEEWRQGYWEVLMGMAEASENLEGWVTTESRKFIWSPIYVPSPSNPDPPEPLPGGLPAPPEEERLPAGGQPPEDYYMKILTSNGFTTSQRLRAALDCADWFSFKELTDSAEEMYRWALDIAISGLSTPDPTIVLNPKTGVLASSPEASAHLTPNIVLAVTELATFHAQHNNTTAALPILISLLRARLSAPEAPETIPAPQPSPSMISQFIDLLIEPTYPPLPPTGDDPFLRKDTQRCEEAALKSYIGEILFATANATARSRRGAPADQTPGLSWVRDAVSTSKQAQSIPAVEADSSIRKHCETCEEIGLEAWGKILTYLVASARDDIAAVKRGWGPSALAYKYYWGLDQLEQKAEDLAEEEIGVTMRLHKLRMKVYGELLREQDRKHARTFVF
ncbi:unnamed protein product [Periconia digitata]|uniref:Uncharacterized protein n=1 Tax=Periconia digitata TaxID=1303443 RepID=A0A9W4XP30_9PLEO|nr:unnamed protein product [Periconia digitata]